MSRTLTVEQQDQARKLADDLRDQAAEIFQEVSEVLSSVPDEKLFGDTEFLVRQQIIKLVAAAFTTRLAQKKTATSAVPANAPTASERPSFTAIKSEIP